MSEDLYIWAEEVHELKTCPDFRCCGGAIMYEPTGDWYECSTCGGYGFVNLDGTKIKVEDEDNG